MESKAQEKHLTLDQETIDYISSKASYRDIETKLYTTEKLHSKLLIADNTVFLSSINWNQNSIENNREIGIIFQDSGFFAKEFEKDWNQSRGLLIPYETIIMFIIVVTLAWLLAKKSTKCF